MTERKLDANGFPVSTRWEEADCFLCGGTGVGLKDDPQRSDGAPGCLDCKGTGRRTDRSSSSRRMG